MVAGYLKTDDCGAKRAGIAVLFVAEVADVDSFTKNPSGEDWTAVVMNDITPPISLSQEGVKIGLP